MGLVRYQQKRNFSRTPEPKGAARKRQPQALSFVIQKHAARRLHYDFRLEMEGVLKSWAVPKGIPTTKGEKRLAMHVEDHPLEYARFEGNIPEGQYGAGSVMVWDYGTYDMWGDDPINALKSGKLHFVLHGKKLQGEWTLVRMRGGGEEGKDPWLLIKSGSSIKPIAKANDDSSALSGRAMEEIARRARRTWTSNRDAAKPRKAALPGKSSREDKTRRASTSSAALRELATNLKKFPRAAPAYVEPMKALLVKAPPAGDEWTFEIKWDGYRELAIKKEGEVQLFSRRGRESTGDFPEIARALGEIPAKNFVLDGEVVALDEMGRSRFQLLQKYKHKLKTGEAQHICYYVFDLINLENHDLRSGTLADRKALLQTLLKDVPDPIRFSASFEGDADLLLAAATKKGIEGLIAKRRHSHYETGRRSGAWQKIKLVNEQEFVIGGYTEPKGSRPFFGAILVGFYDKGKLIFASKVGSGFDHESLQRLYKEFQRLKTDRCPFANLPSARPGRSGLSAAEMRRCTWVKPELVCQIRFSEWTSDSGLRQPVFLGLREDKKPAEVVRELPRNVA